MQALELDSHKLVWHPMRIRRIQAGRAAPLTIELGPTGACNHNCLFCAFDYSKRTERIPIKTIQKFFGSIPTSIVDPHLCPQSVHLAGDGESTLHPYFPEIVAYAANHRMAVGVTTNGSRRNALCQAGPQLTWCRFSINAGTQETYARIHGITTELEETFETVAVLKGGNPKCTVGVQCLILDQSREGISMLLRRCEMAGVDYVVFKPYSEHPQSAAQVNTTAGLHIRETVKEYLEHRKNASMRIVIRYEGPPKEYTGCLAAATAFWFIASNGEVYPCAPFVGNVRWCFGNIHYQTYLEIAKSRMARSIISDLADLDCRKCRHPCRCDAANRYLHRLNSPEAHDCFL